MALLLCGAAAGGGASPGAATTQESAQEAAAERATADAGSEAMADGQVRFSYVSMAPGRPAWEIRLGKDRTGTFREGEGARQAPGQPLHVSEAVWKRVKAGMPAVRKGRCETKQKGIAQTGAKTFAMGSGPASASCTFNYSEDEALNDAATVFLALAETMQEGAKLQQDQRFNKLALDADMDVLLGEIAAGRALEPANIASVLQSIVEDDHVIDRVRRKAARLLQTSADKPR